MTKRILLTAFYLFALLGLHSQTASLPPPVRFINTGELISTPSFDRNESDEYMLLTQVSTEDGAEIMEYSEERNWPAAIRTLEARNNVRPQISEYKAWVVADLYRSVVLIIPPSQNQHMPAGMRPERNIYFVIQDGGIENGESYTKPQVKISDFPPSGTPASASAPVSETRTQTSSSASPSLPASFNEQLNFLITQMPAAFPAVKGAKIEKKTSVSFSVYDEYESKIQLEGSEQSYLSISKNGLYGTFIAVYGEYRSLSEAQAAYKALVKRVQDAPLPCCSLAESSLENETITNTFWLPFDVSGKMDSGLSNLLLEVKWIKNVSWDKNYNSFDVWRLTLTVGRQN